MKVVTATQKIDTIKVRGYKFSDSVPKTNVKRLQYTMDTLRNHMLEEPGNRLFNILLVTVGNIINEVAESNKHLS